MSKVIMFSRTFPAYHPKAGQPTFFVEKFLKSNSIKYNDCVFEHSGYSFWSLNRDKKQTVSNFIDADFQDPMDFAPKHHTIRAGHRFKSGGVFSPRVWSVKPYNSKQIIIAPDIEVKKVWNIEMDLEGVFKLDGKYIDVTSSICDGKTIADNDGLSSDDLLNWFPFGKKTFDGQIICWNENINY